MDADKLRLCFSWTTLTTSCSSKLTLRWLDVHSTLKNERRAKFSHEMETLSWFWKASQLLEFLCLGFQEEIPSLISSPASGPIIEGGGAVTERSQRQFSGDRYSPADLGGKNSSDVNRLRRGPQSRGPGRTGLIQEFISDLEEFKLSSFFL